MDIHTLASRRTRFCMALAALISAAALAPSAGSASPSDAATFTPQPFPQAPAVTPPELDEATRRALELEGLVSEHRAQQDAIATRILVTSERMRYQDLEIDLARARLGVARERYEQRLIRMYKDGRASPVSLLLASTSFEDFLARVTYVSRLAMLDSDLLQQATVLAAETEYQASVLEDLRAQDVELRRIMRERVTGLERELTEQRALEASLTAKARSAVLARRRLDSNTRAQWLATSIPLGTPIPLVPATITEYPGLSWLVPLGQPDAYESAGVTFTAVCSWYGPGFNGKLTASGQIYNQEDLTCASKTLPFGTRLALTRGDKRVIVVVNDRGPFIAGRDLDLSHGAAVQLGFSGVVPVFAEVVHPAS